MEIGLGVFFLFLVIGICGLGIAIIHNLDKMLHPFTPDEMEQIQQQNEIFPRLVKRY